MKELIQNHKTLIITAALAVAGGAGAIYMSAQRPAAPLHDAANTTVTGPTDTLPTVDSTTATPTDAAPATTNPQPTAPATTDTTTAQPAPAAAPVTNTPAAPAPAQPAAPAKPQAANHPLQTQTYMAQPPAPTPGGGTVSGTVGDYSSTTSTGSN